MLMINYGMWCASSVKRGNVKTVNLDEGRKGRRVEWICVAGQIPHPF